MNTVTRRGLILSGAGLATAAFVAPAEAATGAVSLHIASAGFIFGVTGGSGDFDLQRASVSAQDRRHQRRRSDRRLGDGSGRHRVEPSRAGRHRRPLLGRRRRHGCRRRQKRHPALQRQRRILRLRGRQVGFSFSIDLSGMSISLA